MDTVRLHLHQFVIPVSGGVNTFYRFVNHIKHDWDSWLNNQPRRLILPDNVDLRYYKNFAQKYADSKLINRKAEQKFSL